MAQPSFPTAHKNSSVSLVLWSNSTGVEQANVLCGDFLEITNPNIQNMDTLLEEKMK